MKGLKKCYINHCKRLMIHVVRNPEWMNRCVERWRSEGDAPGTARSTHGAQRRSVTTIVRTWSENDAVCRIKFIDT